MALSLRRPEHPSSPVLCQNLKCDRLLGRWAYSVVTLPRHTHPVNHKEQKELGRKATTDLTDFTD